MPQESLLFNAVLAIGLLYIYKIPVLQVVQIDTCYQNMAFISDRKVKGL